MSEEEVIAAYITYALSGNPLSSEAQAAKYIFQNFVREQFRSLPEGLKSAISWESFYVGKRDEYHRKAVQSVPKFPIMPRDA